MGLILITNLQLLLNVILLTFAGFLILVGMYMSDEDSSIASKILGLGCWVVEYINADFKCMRYVKKEFPQAIGTYGGYLLVFYALGRFVWYLSLSLCGSAVKLMCPCFFPKEVPTKITEKTIKDTENLITRETVFETRTKHDSDDDSDRRMVVSGKKRHIEKRTGESSRKKLKEIEYYKHSSSKKSHRKPKAIGAIEYYPVSEDDKKSRKKKNANGEIKTFETSDGNSNSPESQDIENNLDTDGKKKHRKRRDKEEDKVEASGFATSDAVIDIESTNDELDNDQSGRKKSEKKERRKKKDKTGSDENPSESGKPDEVIDIESTNDELDDNKKEKKIRKKKSSKKEKKSSKKIKNGSNESNNDETDDANQVLDETVNKEMDQVTENVDNQNYV